MPPSSRERCPLCDIPMAVDADRATVAKGAASGLCWGAYDRGCPRLPVDWRARALALRAALAEYGRHAEGCSAAFGPQYQCRCGWSDEEAKLVADNG